MTGGPYRTQRLAVFVGVLAVSVLVGVAGAVIMWLLAGGQIPLPS